MDLSTAILSRRTVKRFTGAALDRSQVEKLMVLACWAPNHRHSQPWRFRACDQTAAKKLGLRLAGDSAFWTPIDAHKQSKTQELLSHAGAVLLVTWIRQSDATKDREDHAAAAAAVQNLLLAATAAGLGSFWCTSLIFSHPRSLAQWGIDTSREGFLGAIFLGQSAEIPLPPPRLPLGERLFWLTMEEPPTGDPLPPPWPASR